MPVMDYGLYDADNHYYEPRDCFTRHIAPAMRDRAIHVATDPDGRDVVLVGDRPFTFLVDPFRDVAAKPGSLREMLRSMSSGRVYPAEVERVLHDDPRVAACAVVGRPDERLGERVVAFVQRAAGATVSSDELRAHCESQLAGTRCPTSGTSSMASSGRPWGRSASRLCACGSRHRASRASPDRALLVGPATRR